MGSNVKGCLAVSVLEIDVGIVLEEQLDYALVAVFRGLTQRLALSHE